MIIYTLEKYDSRLDSWYKVGQYTWLPDAKKAAENNSAKYQTYKWERADNFIIGYRVFEPRFRISEEKRQNV